MILLFIDIISNYADVSEWFRCWASTPDWTPIQISGFDSRRPLRIGILCQKNFIVLDSIK